MVDLTTLPAIEAGTRLTAGQRFTIRGSGFSFWPSDLVLGFNEIESKTHSFGGFFLMSAVSKTDEEIVFEVANTHSYGSDVIWKYIGTPKDAPRELLGYEGV